MSAIKPDIAGEVRHSIHTASVDLTVGVYNADDGYWSSRNCLRRIRGELQKAIDIIDRELQQARQAAE